MRGITIEPLYGEILEPIHGVTMELEKVLVILSRAPVDASISVQRIASQLELSEQRAQYFLDRLIRWHLVTEDGVLISGAMGYALSVRGREYLVEMGKL